MSKDNGGPAFPSDELSQHSDSARSLNQQFQGMTLRDYFAAKAMQGMLSGRVEMFGPADKLVETAFKLSDAMLLERAK